MNNEDVQSLGLPRQLREDLKDFKLSIWRKGPGEESDKSKTPTPANISFRHNFTARTFFVSR